MEEDKKKVDVDVDVDVHVGHMASLQMISTFPRQRGVFFSSRSFFSFLFFSFFFSFLKEGGWDLLLAVSRAHGRIDSVADEIWLLFSLVRM